MADQALELHADLLADAHAVFRHLEAHDARVADLLAGVPVRRSIV